MSKTIPIGLAVLGTAYHSADEETKAKIRKDVDEMFRTNQVLSTVYRTDQADGEEPLRNDKSESVDVYDDAAWEKHLHSLVGTDIKEYKPPNFGSEPPKLDSVGNMSETEGGRRQLQIHQAKLDHQFAHGGALSGRVDVTDDAAWAEHLRSLHGKDSV